MKILKIFGIVVGIHVFALVLIFANPGCSTSSKPPPTPSDTLASSAPPPAIAVPNTSSGVYSSGPEAAPVTAAPHASAPVPVSFDPNAVATSSPAPATAMSSSSSTTVRFTPTRPGTPVAGTLVAEKVTDVTPATTYVVKTGDSLWSIAKRHKLTVSDLTAANGIAANANLQPGKKLLIPAKSVPVAALAATPPPAARAKEPAAPKVTGDSVRHTVRSGETLGSIARNYGVRQSDIAVANRISDPARILAGMELIIPGAPTGGAKKAKGAAKAANGEKVEPKTEEVAPAVTPPANQPPVVPIIRIDESPVTPAPKP